MILEGKNAVNEALKNLKPIDKILIKSEQTKFKLF